MALASSFRYFFSSISAFFSSATFWTAFLMASKMPCSLQAQER
jgi:hypothetical protein